MAITHSVFFNLVHAQGSDEESEFFEKSLELLRLIPGVQGFTVLNQTSPKCDFAFGFSMVFASQSNYDSYNNHPDHARYVSEIWLKEVENFQEIDFVIHPNWN